MISLRIEKETSFKDIDTYYRRLNNLINEDAAIDLIVPDRLTNNYSGIAVAIFQFAATWLRYPKSSKLIIDLGNKKEIDFEDLVQDEFLFPILTLAWNDKEIFDLASKYDLRRALKDPLNSVFRTMRKFRTIKGKKLMLFHSDHFNEKIGILKCFEIGDKFINDETRISKNLAGGLAEVLDYSKDIKIQFKKIAKPTNEIIYELMKNTHNWAKKDYNDVVLLPNIRGLYVRFFKKTRNLLLKDFSDHKGLKQYFNSNKLAENPKGELYFIELSVFDTGIGMTEKWKSYNIQENESDINILRKCLTKHMTSDDTLSSEDRGKGLDRMLNVLDGKGFLRIKTGSLCVYRNLISNPYRKLNNYESMYLKDWDTHEKSDFPPKIHCSGTTISIIYPLLYNE